MTPQMMNKLARIESQDEDKVRDLKGTDGFKENFTATTLQRTFKWGYNRSYRTCYRLVEQGELKRTRFGFRFIDKLEPLS